jgi:hypothetical protein
MQVLLVRVIIWLAKVFGYFFRCHNLL